MDRTIVEDVSTVVRPTALEIVQNEDLVGKLIGKSIVVTGATSGIGAETARALAATGATLYLTAHNETEVRKAEVTLNEVLQSDRVSLVIMDLASFSSVRTAAADIIARSNGQINILVNNAGVFGVRHLELTKDGHEKHFATNYLGHFLLFHLLKDSLLRSSSSAFSSRVVMVASSNHRTCYLNDSNNYSFEQGGYHHQKAYPQSKLACIYMANEIDRRYGQLGLHATSVHPGGVNTSLSVNFGPEFVKMIAENPRLKSMLKSLQEGAATTVVAAIGKGWEGKGGRYLEDCQEAPRGPDNTERFGFGYAPHTYDPALEARLWSDTLEILGIEDKSKLHANLCP